MQHPPRRRTAGTSDVRLLRGPLFLISFVAVCLACGAPGDGTGSSADRQATVVADSSGVEIVTNRGEGWDAREAWRLELERQVGERDGPAAFGRVNWVAPGPRGGMIVLDAQASRVHAFDVEGAEVSRFGGRGEGPGEFMRPATVTPLADGGYAVGQGFPPLLQWLTAAGDHIGTTRLPIAKNTEGLRTAGTMALWQVTPAGRVFAQVQVIDPAAAGGEMPVFLVEVDPSDGVPPDTIARWTWHAALGGEPLRVFDAVPSWMPRADGVVVLAAGRPYEIQWHDPSAGLVRVMRRQVDEVPVTDRHREKAIADMREGMEAGGGQNPVLDDMLENAEFESTLPDVLRVWVSRPDGRLWVGVHDAELFEVAGDTPDPTWANALDVFERDGRYLGRIPIPDGFRLRVVTEDALYGVWSDELDVTFARKYRILR